MTGAEATEAEQVRHSRVRWRWRRLAIIAGAVSFILISAGIVTVMRVQRQIGAGRRMADQTTQANILPSFTEVVADLDYPPGNIAVSSSGRRFITFHPVGGAPMGLAELVGVSPVAYPREGSAAAKKAPPLRSPLAVRVDQQNRLWVLDYGYYGIMRPRLLAFDLGTDALAEEYAFPRDVAPLLSMLNDFQVDPAGRKVYIADTGPIRQNPALVVYDIATRSSRRLLEGHPALQAQDFVIQAPGRDMDVYGLFPLRVGLDSIALDKEGKWLYFGPMSGDRLYRIATADLNDESLTAEELGQRVEDYGPKTISDGLSMDEFDDVYITDPEHSAILMLDPDGRLTTLVKDSPLRWPDGLSFGPDGWLYVTCSALHQVQFMGRDSVAHNAPYQVIRFKPGVAGIPGR